MGLQEGEGEVSVESPFLPGKKMLINLYSEDKIYNVLRKVGFKMDVFS